MTPTRIYKVVPIGEDTDSLPSYAVTAIDIDGDLHTGYLSFDGMEVVCNSNISDNIYYHIKGYLEEVKEPVHVLTPEQLKEEMEDFALTCVSELIKVFNGTSKYGKFTPVEMTKELYKHQSKEA